TATVIGTSMVLTLITMASATVMHAATNHLVDAVLALILMIGGVIGAKCGANGCVCCLVCWCSPWACASLMNWWCSQTISIRFVMSRPDDAATGGDAHNHCPRVRCNSCRRGKAGCFPCEPPSRRDLELRRRGIGSVRYG